VYIALTAIGLCTVNFKCAPNPIGNFPYLSNFQELLMLKGTTKAFGMVANKVSKPLVLKGFGAPVLLRVPSGKITALQLFSAILVPNPLMALSDCTASFLSIRTEPPWRRL